jgi:RimJ/RimL family protein N-acetyltransferase
MLDKTQLPQRVMTARTVVRKAVPEDLPRLAAWPRYPFPHEALSVAGPFDRRSPDGKYWWQQIEQPDRCHYSVILRGSGDVIGVHALVQIDWAETVVHNMGVRLHPDLCSQGYGTETLRPLLEAVLAAGIQCIRLDVLVPNQRAVRCYERSGMRIVGEFWQKYHGPAVVLSDPKWASAVPHFRREGDAWMVRSYWMEIGGSRGTAAMDGS